MAALGARAEAERRWVEEQSQTFNETLVRLFLRLSMICFYLLFIFLACSILVHPSWLNLPWVVFFFRCCFLLVCRPTFLQETGLFLSTGSSKINAANQTIFFTAAQARIRRAVPGDPFKLSLHNFLEETGLFLEPRNQRRN